MADYHHHVTGFFSNRHDAQNALFSLVEQGLPRDRLQISRTDSSSPGPAIGDLIRATTGVFSATPPEAGKKHGWLSTLMLDAISSGQIALVVQTRTEQETSIARELLQSSVGDCKEISPV